MGGIFGDAGRDFFVKGTVILEDKTRKAFAAIQQNTTNLGKSMMTMGSRIRSTGQSMTIGLTAPIIGMGVAIVKVAGQFGDEMAKIIGLSAASAEQVGLWREEVLQLAVAMGKSPQELAEGLFFLASAGLKVGTEMDVLNIVAKASVAGLGEVKVIAMALANVIAAYGQENIDTADTVGVMVAAVSSGNLEADEMAEVFGRLLPLAVELGITFPELTASLSSLSLINADASENASGFLGVMTSFAKETPQADRALKAVGLSFDKLRESLKERGLIETIIDLTDRLGGIGEVQKVFPRIRGLTAILNLTGEQAEETTRTFQELKDAGAKDLEFAFNAMQTPAQNMRVVMVKVQVALVRLEPVIAVIASVLGTVVGAIEKVGAGFGKLPSPVQKAIVIIALLVAAFGPFLIVVGAVVASIGAIIAAKAGMITFFLAMRAGASLALGPVGILVTGLTMLGVAIFGLIRKYRDGSDAGNEFAEKLAAIAREAELLNLDPIVATGTHLAAMWLSNETSASALLTQLSPLAESLGVTTDEMRFLNTEGQSLAIELFNLIKAQQGWATELALTDISVEQATEIANLLGVSLSDLEGIMPELGGAASRMGVEIDDLEETLEPAGQDMDDYAEAIKGVAEALNTDLTDALSDIASILTREEAIAAAAIDQRKFAIAVIMEAVDFNEKRLNPSQEATIALHETEIERLEGVIDKIGLEGDAYVSTMQKMEPGLITLDERNELLRIMADRLEDTEIAEFLATSQAGKMDEALAAIEGVDPTLANQIRTVLGIPLQESLDKTFVLDHNLKALLSGVQSVSSGIDSFQALPGPLGSNLHGTQFVPKTGLSLLHAGEVVLSPGQTAAALSGDTFIFNVQLGGRATNEDAEEFMDMIESKLRARRIRFQ